MSGLAPISAPTAGSLPSSPSRASDEAEGYTEVDASIAKKANVVLHPKLDSCLRATLPAMPDILLELIEGYMPPPPTVNQVKEIACELLRKGKASVEDVPLELRQKAEDCAPYIRGVSLDLSDYEIRFLEQVEGEDARYDKAQKVIETVLQLLPGITLEVRSQFTWMVSPSDAEPFSPWAGTKIRKIIKGETKKQLNWKTVQERLGKLALSLNIIPKTTESTDLLHVGKAPLCSRNDVSRPIELSFPTLG